MAGFDQAFARLNKAGSKVTSLRGDVPQKLVLRELRPAYSALCAAYENTTPEQRIDTYLFFETRDNLLEELMRFAGDSAQKAVASHSAQKLPMAQSLLKQAAAADLIVDGRCEPRLLDSAQASLLKAIDTVGFDLNAYTSRLSVSASELAKRAIHLQKEGCRLEAIKALGIALQMNPALVNHPKALEVASSLTGQSGSSAIVLLSDPFQRGMFIAEQTREQDKKAPRRKRKEAGSPLTFWLTTLVGFVILAALPPLLFGVDLRPGHAPTSLIVGAVTSVTFVMSQLKRRP